MGLIDENDAVERVDVWECIGCGKIEEARPCIGVCQDRRTTFVRGAAYDAASARNVMLRARVDLLEAFLRRLIHTQPRDAQWERSFRAVQAQAGALLNDGTGRDT